VCSKIPILASNKFKLLCYRVHDLDITSEVPIPIDCAELVESLICDLGHIQLMVAYQKPIPIRPDSLDT
jgi:hypothetical protein